MKDELEKVVDRIASSSVPKPQDYTDSETGLLHCGNCNTPKECRVTIFGKEKLMPCICRCRSKQLEAEEAARKEQQRLDRIRRLKANGLQDRALFDYTFEQDDGTNPAMRHAHSYVGHWTQMKEQGRGLLLWGGVGTGKTFAAACIANALTEQGVPVLMTNFSKILNSLSGMFSEDKNRYLASFKEFDLLIIDDLGIERNSEYAQEQVYNVVDSRYLSRLPFIITTNLTVSELKNPKDTAHARIYDRILERCAPILFGGKNYRTDNAEATKNAIREIISKQEDSL